MSEFQKTVDLKQKMEAAKQPKPAPKKKAAPAPVKKAPERSKAEDIDRVFRPSREEAADNNNNNKIDIPKPSGSYDVVYKIIIFLLLIAVVVFGVMYMKKDTKVLEKSVAEENETKWYAVKLVTDEIFYGQIGDTAKDPITISNVYYNYDQLKEDGEENGSSNLRLVKRGKETHGPEGNMDIVRSQVVYMETLKQD